MSQEWVERSKIVLEAQHIREEFEAKKGQPSDTGS